MSPPCPPNVGQVTLKGELKAYTQTNNTLVPFTHENWAVLSATETSILQKMKTVGSPLKDLPVTIYRGILTGYNDAFYIDTATKERLIAQDQKCADIIRPLLRGRDIIPYGCEYADLWLISSHNGVKEKNMSPIDITRYPAIKTHLDQFYPQLEKRCDKGDTPYNLRNCAYLEEFAKPKIIYPDITKFFPFYLDTRCEFVTNNLTYFLTAQHQNISLAYLAAIFNSKLAKLWIWFNCPDLGDDRRRMFTDSFENFPIPETANPQQLASLAERRTMLTSDLQERHRKFLKRVSDNFVGVKISRVLGGFADLDFAAFVAELKKQKQSVSLKSQDEWDAYFIAAATECRTLSSTIKQTDAEIDQLVYNLYGLTKEEIGIVEGRNE